MNHHRTITVIASIVAIVIATLATGCGESQAPAETDVREASSLVAVEPAVPDDAGIVCESRQELTEGELLRYAFVASLYGDLSACEELVDAAVAAGAYGDVDTSIEYCLELCEVLPPIQELWGSMGWAYGNVERLERDFEKYLKGVTRFSAAVCAVVAGEAIDEDAAYRAQELIDTYGPRVCDDLLALEAEFDMEPSQELLQ